MARQILVLMVVVGVAQAGLLGGGLGLSTQSIAIGAPTIGLTKVLTQPAVSSQSIQRISLSSGIAAAPVAIAQPAIAAVPVATKVLAQPALSSQSIQRISQSNGVATVSAIASPVVASGWNAGGWNAGGWNAGGWNGGAIGLGAGGIGLGGIGVATKVLAAPAVAVRAEPVDLNPQYKYSYSVEDPNTGDVKSASEVRDGDVVKGQYSLIDSDGTRRIVDYVADGHNGFNAIVRKEPLIQKVAVAAPVAVAAAPIGIAKTTIGLDGLGLAGLNGLGGLGGLGLAH